MNGEAVKELAERFRQPMEIAGNVAYPKDWTLVDPATIKGPTPEKLSVYTLGAVRDYLVANKDALQLEQIVVHVVSPQIVRVLGPLHGVERTRETYVEATAQNLTDNFTGKFIAIEDLVIGLQTRFVKDEGAWAEVMKIVGNVKNENVTTSIDNGYTQTVQATAGVVRLSTVEVPNPAKLTPFRTFREVAQPASLFVLRMQAKNGPLPEAALIEADGGEWRLQAIASIHEWLKTHLPTSVSVLA